MEFDSNRTDKKRSGFALASNDLLSFCLRTANCIIIDHFSAFEPGLVAPFLYAA